MEAASVSPPLGFLQIGLGRIGRMRAEILRSASRRVKLLGVVERATVIDRHRNDLGDVPAFDSTAAAFAVLGASLDAVVVSSPSIYHADTVVEALDCGLAVFCEKPLALDATETTRVREAMDRATAAAGRRPILMIGFQRRFDASIAALRRSLPRMAPIRFLQATNRDPGKPTADYVAASGNIVRDSAVHDIDLHRWLIGQSPTTVYAVADHADPAQATMMNAVFQYDGGLVATVHVARHSFVGYDQRLEAFGDRGQAAIANPSEDAFQLATTTGEIEIAPVCGSFESRYAAAFAAEMSHFIGLVGDHWKGSSRDEQRAHASIEDWIAVEQVVQACERSIRNGTREWIRESEV